MMALATAIKSETDGKFYVTPISCGVAGVPFKEKWQAERVADAINAAFASGQNDVRASLRALIGAAPDENE
ncbi:hypothetical protein AT6N2_C0393 [Agrobacterium tumefaciens]|uniref:hypothetical protein n=1 Tax=Agrobacterium tumefaciens TaxID=358 RepID=UPI001ADB1176|nr:hypothetical protein [Agrobacterium tumefaciens]QTK78301.1 hypothetical protein AT6N2_C0393 [Agrobacterium tumefaciens]